ncbi:MAG: peptide chain release factor N(5)-glutamine methyltransferase [Prevotella sp.]|nr:peptide chain release factor N(5)-glutamine methyltransferase [Prevotella sp.]
MRRAIPYIKESLKAYYPENEISGFIRIIIEYISHKPYPQAYADHLIFSCETNVQIESILERLKRYEPIQYIFGQTEFFGLPFSVNSDTLIPRPETEELVELIINENNKSGLKILDIGTGSGAIAIALAKHLNKADVFAWDFSQRALDMAKHNAERNNVQVEFNKVDVLDDYPKDIMYDIIVSNPPYVLESEKNVMEQNVLAYEPHSALFVPDADALLFYNRIADIALDALRPGGKLYFEINQVKGDETMEVLRKKGFKEVVLFKDLSKNDRMVRGVLF